MRRGSRGVADYPVLEVENFGPVKRAKIELRPLTVLLGKNNTGKSFLASLIYVLGRYAPPITYILEPSEHYSLEEVAERIRADIVDSGKRAISYLTERPESLIRWGAEKAKIKISWHSLRLSIAINSRGNIRVEADIPEKLIKRADKIKIEKEELSHVRFITTLIGPEHPLITRMARWRFALWEPKIMPYRPVYLLAERAGLLRIYRPLLIVYLRTSVPELLPRRLASLMEQVESGMKLPRLAADFISDVLLTEPVHDKTFSDIFELLERLMEGHVELTEELEIIYKTRGYAISLDKSSSLIAELAPFYLILKRIRPGRSIIIEEPEAHVHPAGQVMLSRIFTRLVRKGTPVLITTHSTLIPIALAHLVGLSRLSPESREKLGYARDEYLRPEELGIYWLRWDGDGSVAEEVKVRPEGVLEGLPEMDKVIDDLYGEEAKILELSALAPQAS